MLSKSEERRSNIRALVALECVLLGLSVLMSFLAHREGASNAIVVLIIAGVLIGFPLALALSVALFWPLVLLPILFHELGHVVAGKLVGYKLLHLQVGCLLVTPSKKGISIVRSGPLHALNGWAMMKFQGRPSASRWRIFILGGTLASIVFLCLAIWIDIRAHFYPGALTDNDVPAKVVIQNLFLLELNLCSIGALLGTIIPMKIRGNYTDAAHVLLSLTNKTYCEASALFQSLGAELSSGVRPRDWSSESLAALMAMKELGPPLSLTRASLLYYNMLDRQHFQDAARILQEELNRLRTLFDSNHLTEQSLCYEAAFIFAFNGEADRAEDALQVGDRFGFAGNTTRIRAEIALAVLKNDRAEAEAKAQRCIGEIEKKGNVGKESLGLEKEWIQWTLDRLPPVDAEEPAAPVELSSNEEVF